tara:strand:- start:344 stop:697 length:354 start_codon:yes stop_codon:yes gene_type:complete
MIKLKKLLKESTWANRKFGEPLPTMADYKKSHNKKKLKEAKPGFESKDGKLAQKRYLKMYKAIKNGEGYFASSVDNLADLMERQGLKNQAQLLRGEYQMTVTKWYEKWLKQFVKSLK